VTATEDRRTAVQSIVPLALLFSIALALAATFPRAVSAVNADLHRQTASHETAPRDLSERSAFQWGG
jgi:hypothetical protein